MNEQRRVHRTRVDKRAKVIFDLSLRDCIVCDISSFGARLVFMDILGTLNSFELTFDAGRTLRKCRVAWSSETQVGVEFQETLVCPAA
jgi:hypothetical protein